MPRTLERAGRAATSGAPASRRRLRMTMPLTTSKSASASFSVSGSSKKITLSITAIRIYEDCIGTARVVPIRRTLL